MVATPPANGADQVFTDVASSTMADANKDSLGACWADYDNDGDVDVFVANLGVSKVTGHGRSRLWRNDGGGVFVNQAHALGLRDALGYPNGCAWADIDEDGDPDLVVTQRLSDPTITTKIFENTGSAGFVDRTASSGISRYGQGDSSVDIADTDNYGLLDVVIAARTTKGLGLNALYRQTGPFTFVDEGAETGLADPIGPDNVFAIGTHDYDLDGDLDALVVNDFWGIDMYRRDGGVYTRATNVFPPPAEKEGSDPDNPMGIGWGDFNNDGHTDAIVPGMDSGPTPDLRTVLYRSNGDGTFSDVTDAVGITVTGRVHWSGQFVDIDNDGDKDISIVAGKPHALGAEGAEPNVVWVNQLMETGTATFVDKTEALGLLSMGTSRSGAWADFNHDGRLDFFVTGRETANRLFRNDGPAGHALMVRPLGAGSEATGTWVKIKVGSSYRYDYVRGLDGFLTQSLVPVHFGVGAATTVDEVWLRRPSTTVWTLACSNVPTDATLTITETGDCSVGAL